jgi:hypothetical protein
MSKLITFISIAIAVALGLSVPAGKPIPVAPTADPSPAPTLTAGAVFSPPAPDVLLSAPHPCPNPPPWAGSDEAYRCWQHYPAPFESPLPHCPLDYTLGVWLTCWGYIAVNPVIYQGTVTPTPPGLAPATPTPHTGYPGYP